jgi:hypothetical protein
MIRSYLEFHLIAVNSLAATRVRLREGKMFRNSGCIVFVFILTGCAQSTTWVKPGASPSDFYQAKSRCEALALGATPMDYSSSSSSTTYHSGSISSSNGGYGTYSGTSTTYNNNLGQALGNLGQAIQRESIFEDCIRGHGFSVAGEPASFTDGNGNTVGKIGESSYVEDIQEWEETSASFSTADAALEPTKLLSKPSFSGYIVATVSKSQELEVLGTAAEHWLKVRYSDKTGYVAEKWIENTRGSASQAKDLAQETQVSRVKAKQLSIGRVKWSQANIYDQPKAGANLVRTLVEGHRIVILGKPSDDWLQVRFGGVEGYMNAYRVDIKE